MKAFVFFLVLQRASKSAPIDAGYSVVAPLSLPPYSMKYLNTTQNEKKKIIIATLVQKQENNDYLSLHSFPELKSAIGKSAKRSLQIFKSC